LVLLDITHIRMLCKSVWLACAVKSRRTLHTQCVACLQ
jgi:hypothetical protein